MQIFRATGYRISWWETYIVLLILILLVSCDQEGVVENESITRGSGADSQLTLPPMDAVDLAEGKLAVVATTSIIGDVVGNVGGESIELLTLLAPGQDPHSFEPAAGTLVDVAKADVIFINGWNLEESLIDDLNNVAENAVIVPVSAGIQPLYSPYPKDGSDLGIDPHTWLDPHLARTWVNNIKQTLLLLDPKNEAVYEERAASYLAQLDDLIGYYNEQVGRIPEDRRQLVTNHDSFGYFADAYHFEISGVIIPSSSTLAEPSSGDLVRLVDKMEEAGVCTIFTETSSRSQLAETVTAELENCDTVEIVPLFSGALGPAGSESDNYVGMMKANIDAIVASLK